jgi:mono/diheme cytochrome c family protein
MKPLLLLALLPMVLASSAHADERAVQLKDASGKTKVMDNCVVCHSVDYVQMNSPFLDRKGWEAEVDKMTKSFGAPVKEEDVPQIVDYLIKYYGREEPAR